MWGQEHWVPSQSEIHMKVVIPQKHDSLLLARSLTDNINNQFTDIYLLYTTFLQSSKLQKRKVIKKIMRRKNYAYNSLDGSGSSQRASSSSTSHWAGWGGGGERGGVGHAASGVAEMEENPISDLYGSNLYCSTTNCNLITASQQLS